MIQSTVPVGGGVGRAHRQSPWPICKVEYVLAMAQSVVGEVPFTDECSPEDQEWYMSTEYQGLQTFQKGDVGLAIVVMVVDTGGNPIDLRGASAKVIRVGFPSGISKDFAASFATDGSDGAITYVTAAVGDLDQAGDYTLQGIVTLNGSTTSTLVTSLIGRENVPVPVVPGP